MQALCDALAPEFGAAKIFRPYRDVRFAKDKTPYKTHQGAFVAAAPRTGWYVELSPRGVRTGAGFYDADSRQLAGIRAGLDDDLRGQRFADILSTLPDRFEVGGDTLKTTPRGFDADHPRIELLRHKTLFAGHLIGFEPVIHTEEVADMVREDWRALRPLVEWLAEAGAP